MKVFARATLVALGFSAGSLLGLVVSCHLLNWCGIGEEVSLQEAYLWSLVVTFLGALVPALVLEGLAYRVFASLSMPARMIGMGVGTVMPFIAVGLVSIGPSFLHSWWVVIPIAVGGIGGSLGYLLSRMLPQLSSGA